MEARKCFRNIYSYGINNKTGFDLQVSKHVEINTEELYIKWIYLQNVS